MSSKKKSLLYSLTLDTSGACLSALSITPAISIIDKAIFLNASGSTPLITAAATGLSQFFKNPIAFARQPSCYLIFGVYSGTYLVANYIQTLCDHNNTPWKFPKFIGSSVANVSLSLGKDVIFFKPRSISLNISERAS